jgi:hypothetical protein
MNFDPLLAGGSPLDRGSGEGTAPAGYSRFPFLTPRVMRRRVTHESEGESAESWPTTLRFAGNRSCPDCRGGLRESGTRMHQGFPCGGGPLRPTSAKRDACRRRVLASAALLAPSGETLTPSSLPPRSGAHPRTLVVLLNQAAPRRVSSPPRPPVWMSPSLPPGLDDPRPHLGTFGCGRPARWSSPAPGRARSARLRRAARLW